MLMAVMPRTDVKSARFELRCRVADKEVWAAAAAAGGLTLAEWLESAAWDAVLVQRAEEQDRRDRELLVGAAYPQRAA